MPDDLRLLLDMSGKDASQLKEKYSQDEDITMLKVFKNMNATKCGCR